MAVGPVLAAPCDSSSTSLENGGFEVPPQPADTFAFYDAVDVPPWQTTDSLGKIEIWGDGFLGVPAAEGDGFAEINANSPGTLYQDVVSTPGETMTWTLQHHGRQGNDVMRVLIGDANTADVASDTGWNYFSPDLTDGVTAWGTHTDQYVVPVGQTCTRFGFRSISTATGNASVGNLLDDVSFAISIPPTPTPGATPTPTPTPTPGATPTPTPTPDPNLTPRPSVTIPATSTSASTAGRDRDEPTLAVVLLALVGLCAGSWLIGRRPARPR